MARSKPSKRQAKLSFSPLSDESRYATVTYQGASPTKRRRMNDFLQPILAHSDGPSSSAALAALHSPPRSSVSTQQGKRDVPAYRGDNDADIDHGFDVDSDTSQDSLISKPLKQKSKSKRKAPESSQVFSRPPVISPKPRRQRSPLPNVRSDAILIASSSSEEDALLSIDDSDGEQPVTPSKPAAKGGRLIETESDGVSTPGLPVGINGPAKTQEADDEDDDSDIAPPATQRRRRNASPVITIGDSGEGESEEGSDDEDDEDQPIQATPLRHTRSSGRRRKMSPETHHEVPEQSDDDDDDDAAPSSSRRKRSLKLRRRAESGSEGSESDGGVTASARKRRRRPLDSEEQEEVANDAEDLKTSTVFRDEEPTSSRPSKQDQRRSRLQELKARRNRTASSPVNVDDDTDEEDGDPDDIAEYDPHDDNGEEMDDFVVEEDGEGEGEDAGHEGMTDYYLMKHGQLKLKEHWEYVVEWMLSNRLNRGGAISNEPYYKLSIHRVNRECEAYVDRLVSSAWVPIFTRALKARPDYEEAPLIDAFLDGDLGGGKCSACNRSGHPATFSVRLRGKAYDRTTLDPLKDEDEDDEDSVNEDGHELVDEQREFRLGKFCRSNAMNAHGLIHWRMRLKDWIEVYLKQNKYLKTKRIAERDTWSTAKKAKLVLQIVEQLKKSGAIRALWKEFSEKLASAPNVQGQRYR